MNQPNQKFPALVTAATQAELNHPEFGAITAFWRAHVANIRVLVPSNAVTKPYDGVNYLRMLNPYVRLLDVVEQAAHLVGAMVPSVIIQDPLVCAGKTAMSVIHPEFVAKNGHGNAWAATAEALTMAGSVVDGQPQGIESGVLRWFIFAENTIKVMRSGTLPIDPNIPFTQPVWGGTLAYWCQRRLMETRYHDMSGMNAVASWMPEVPSDVDLAGYPLLALNPPSRVYLKELEPYA